MKARPKLSSVKCSIKESSFGARLLALNTANLMSDFRNSLFLFTHKLVFVILLYESSLLRSSSLAWRYCVVELSGDVLRDRGVYFLP